MVPSPRRFSLFHLALMVPWIAVARAAFHTVSDNSFLWHVRAGDIQASAGEVLTSDPFSLALRGTDWVTQSWLAELFYAWADGDGGVLFVGPMILVASTIAILGVGLASFSRSKSVPATAITVILTTVLLPMFLVPRPVLLSYALLALVIVAWDRPGARWTLPFVFWLWASVHGSFAIGLVYVGLMIVARREWRATPVAFFSGVATLMTAHGLGVVRMLLDFLGSRRYLDHIIEWQTPDFFEIRLAPVLIGLLVLLYGAMKGRVKTGDLWVIAPFLALTFSAERAVGAGWMVLAPLVAASLAGVQIKRFRGFSSRVAMVTAGAILVIPLALIEPVQIDTEKFPIEAAEMIDDVPTFHDDFVGGYLIWRYGPDFPVFIDDRAELYRERIEEFAGIRFGGQSWETAFERDGIRQALLKAEEPLREDLAEAGWVLSYEDDFFVVMHSPS